MKPYVTPDDYRNLALLKGLEFVIKTGWPINTLYTFDNLLPAISQITGKKYTRKTAGQAVIDLKAHIDNRLAMLDTE